MLYHKKWYSDRGSGLTYDDGLRVRDHVVDAGGDADGCEDAGNDRHDDGGELDEGLGGLAEVVCVSSLGTTFVGRTGRPFRTRSTVSVRYRMAIWGFLSA